MGTHRPLPRLALLAGLIGLLTAGASLPSSERPASLLTRNLIMSRGLPYVPLSDLGRALGGTGRYDQATRRLELQPGSGGVLVVNPGALSAFAAASRSAGGTLRDVGPGLARTPLALRLAGHEIAIGNPEEVLLGPTAPALSLNFLAHLLGGRARFDAGRAAWVLPAGGAASPLAFR